METQPLIALKGATDEEKELTALTSLRIVLKINSKLRCKINTLEQRLAPLLRDDHIKNLMKRNATLRKQRDALYQDRALLKKVYLKFLEVCPEDFASTTEIIDLIDRCDEALGL